MDYAIKRYKQTKTLIGTTSTAKHNILIPTHTDTQLCIHAHTHSHTYLLFLQGTRERKKSQTHITLKRLFSRVCPPVLIQASLLAEGLAALRALVWLLLESVKRDHHECE